MPWETAKAEHIGGRDEQQDRVDTFATGDGEACLLLVADGMGGHQGGAIASQTLVDTAQELWRAERKPLAKPENFLRQICTQAHQRINTLGEEQGISPRSTCVALYIGDKSAHWMSVGDSRLYHFRGGTLVEHTRDQSVVQMLVDMGKITEAEMADHPDQNKLLHSVGGDQIPEPQFGTVRIKQSDGFVLCSDGLWEQVGAAEMAAGLAERSLAEAAESFVRRAAERGGARGDNVTVALARAVAGKGIPRSVVVGLFVLLVAAAAALSSMYLLPHDRGGGPIPGAANVPLPSQGPAEPDKTRDGQDGDWNNPDKER